EIVGFDIHVNTSYRLTTNGSAFDLETIVRHEAGHAIGLGHTDRYRNVMYPVIGWSQTKPLGPGDRAGNRALHPYRDYGVRVMERDPDGQMRMLPGGRSTVAVKLKNTGMTPWNGRFRGIQLRTDGPRKRDSRFFDPPTWVSPSQPGERITGVVCHGEVVTVRWAMKAPSEMKRYREAFGVRIGKTWMTNESPVWDVAVPG
ncbi:MAG TPA: matrixin family metalloprotease, partial [Actinomycetota bacterium]|nr:matrixin family metalloprotease [Actinomycetota bacterium]